MPLFSTVFFINGNPVGYNVFESKAGELILKPAENTNRQEKPPLLSAHLIKGSWIIKGSNNQSLIEQVQQDLSLNRFLLNQPIIAAP